MSMCRCAERREAIVRVVQAARIGDSAAIVSAGGQIVASMRQDMTDFARRIALLRGGTR